MTYCLSAKTALCLHHIQFNIKLSLNSLIIGKIYPGSEALKNAVYMHRKLKTVETKTAQRLRVTWSCKVYKRKPKVW